MNKQEQKLFLTHAMALGAAIALINKGTGTAVEDIENSLWTAAVTLFDGAKEEEVSKDFDNYKQACERKGSVMFCIRFDPSDLDDT